MIRINKKQLVSALCILISTAACHAHQATYYPILKMIKSVDTSFNSTDKYDGNQNICLIKHPTSDSYLLGYHRDIDLYSGAGKYRTNIEFVELDNKFTEHYKYPSLNNLEKQYKFTRNIKRFSTAQDPRLITLKNKLYMIFNDSVDERNLRQVYIANLDISPRQTKITDITPINYVPGKEQDQKNWSPFVHNDRLHLIYSIDPYIVLEWHEQKKQVTTVYRSVTKAQSKWKFGIIRGGTPVIYIKEYDAYLTFFHSSQAYKPNEPEWEVRQGPPWRIYYVGAMLIDNKPPFAIKAMTTQPLTFDGMYKDKSSNYHIIFPTGIVENGDDILISAGYQDSQALILKVSKQELHAKLDYLLQGS